MNNQHITLSDDERSTRKRLLAHGTLSARKFKLATANSRIEQAQKTEAM